MPHPVGLRDAQQTFYHVSQERWRYLRTPNNTWCFEEHAEKGHRCWNGSWCSKTDFPFLSLYCMMEAVFFTFTLVFSFAVYSFQANIRGTKTHFLCASNEVLTESTYMRVFFSLHIWVLKLTLNANINELSFCWEVSGELLECQLYFHSIAKNVIREMWKYH